MRELVLQAADDHVAHLAHEGDPLGAVVELVWNAIDAEATSISIEVERLSSDAIEAIRVIDNGHGISSDEVESTFGRIGGSWKQHSRKTKNKIRPLHGKLGQGRLRAFALGSQVVWRSISDNTAGRREEVTINGSRGNRDRFPWDVTPSLVSETGTTVIVYNEEQASLSTLELDVAVPRLRPHFAPVLLNDNNLTITFDGVTLDPQQEIAGDTPILVKFGEADEHDAIVRIIEWKSGSHRSVHFGQDSDHFPYEESGKDFEKQFPYSAYVTWEGLGYDQMAVLGLRDLAGGSVGSLWKAVRNAVREHFTARRRQLRREQVKQWIDSGVYPYKGEPTTEPERAERAVFDVISGTLAPHISSRGKDAQLTLVLLRDALRHDPDKLTTILHEIVSLSETDRATLVRLLSETTLSAIIRSANVVTSRHKFLAGLEHLLFDPIDSGTVGERDHLHKILESELWIFGEGYHAMTSERGLTEMLRTHLRLQGLPERGIEPVKRWDGKSGRVDLHLAVRHKEYDRIRHLVVELKAPNITAGRKEIDQVEDYANVVLSNPAFASRTTTWDFILVVTDYDDLVRRRLLTAEDNGLFLAPNESDGPIVRAYVRRWRDIIDENKRRLTFMTSALEHDPSITEGLKFVREEYKDLLPRTLLGDDGDLGEETYG